MNKTININLGGFFFHIDETAYQKLKRYLDAISRSLSDDPQGKNEIIADIEARISELLSEKITDARQVVNEGDIEEIIAVMGQPEDYAEAEEGYESNSYTRRSTGPSKKLFRDGSDKFLGGVCSGLAHYFNIDVIWVRLAFLVTTLAGFGAGVIIYLILWILLPEAKTTAEKLQMEGEAVNIDNIEKKIRDEFENITAKVKDGAHELTDKISNADYDKLRNQTKSGFQDFLDTLGKIIVTIFKVFGKFMGVILVFVSIITLISLIFGIFSVGSLEILGFDGDFISYPPFFYDATLPFWLLTTCLFAVIGIPFVGLLILGLRILSSNLKKLSTPTVLTLIGIWLVSLFVLLFSGIELATSKAYDGTKVTKHELTYNTEAPIAVRVVNDDDIYYMHTLRRRRDGKGVYVNDEQMKYSSNVKIDVRKSENGNAYIEVKKRSEGKNRKQANEQAEAINYNFKSANNTIVFDAYFLSEYKNMFKDEEIKVTLYIPEGATVFFENSTRNFLYSVDNTEDIYDRDMAKHHFKMLPAGLDCTDCDNDTDDEDEEVSKENSKSTSIIMWNNNDRAELRINKTTTESQLESILNTFASKNIIVSFKGSEFTQEGHIKTLALKVNCNDGNDGSIVVPHFQSLENDYGFIRDYTKSGKSAFKIGKLKK